MSVLRAIYRLAGFVLATLLWVVGIWILGLFYHDKFSAGIHWRMKWLRVMLPFLGIRIVFSRKEIVSASPVIYVANHRSYIDPVVALRYAPNAAIVAKAELASWPLVGPGAAMGGVLFVQRADKESRSTTLDLMSSLLDKGFSLMVFPEGTTSKAPGFLPFKPGAFKLAAQKNIPVVPMAMEFEDPDDAWIGDDTFLRHFLQSFRKRRIIIRMSIGPAFMHEDYEILKTNVHDWIANELQKLSL